LTAAVAELLPVALVALVRRLPVIY
jgi:hypothetical protein